MRLIQRLAMITLLSLSACGNDGQLTEDAARQALVKREQPAGLQAADFTIHTIQPIHADYSIVLYSIRPDHFARAIMSNEGRFEVGLEIGVNKRRECMTTLTDRGLDLAGKEGGAVSFSNISGRLGQANDFDTIEVSWDGKTFTPHPLVAKRYFVVSRHGKVFAHALRLSNSQNGSSKRYYRDNVLGWCQVWDDAHPWFNE